jgi:hypothetical protein
MEYPMSNVVSLNAVRELRNAETSDPIYTALVLGMGKLELLNEMMSFQEERTRKGQLTFKMMVQGQILFKALESSAETDELKNLTRTYRKHLKCELEAYLKNLPKHASRD